MTDLGTDFDSAIELICEAYGKLQKIKPTHPLLRYVETNEAGFRYVDAEYAAFCDEFAPEETTPQLTAMINYYLALDSAISSNDDTKRVPRKPRPEPTNIADTLDGDADVSEELPF